VVEGVNFLLRVRILKGTGRLGVAFGMSRPHDLESESGYFWTRAFVAVIGPGGRHVPTLRLAGPGRPAGGERRPARPKSEPVKRAPVPRELLQVTPGRLQDSHFLQAMSNPPISGINFVLILSYDH
jgi:hypothetical protein